MKSKHLQEWLASGVDPELINRCVKSLSGSSAYDYLIYSDRIERINSGRLTSYWLRKYQHLDHGGWWCNGVEPLTDEQMEWGCFKPDTPKLKVNGKPQKYEHPPKTEARAHFLPATLTIWQRVAILNDVAMPEDIIFDADGQPLGFWRWVIDNQIAIIITEGVKKAAILLTMGFAAVSIPGVWMGRKKVNGQDELIPDLIPFVKKPRIVYFSFDKDKKPETVKSVGAAIARTGELFIKAGCPVRIITWDTPEKGVDDLVVAHGVEVFKNCYNTALPLKQWQWVKRKQLNTIREADVIIDTPQLTKIGLKLPEKGLIVLESPKGTEKTKLIAEVVRDDEYLLSVSHLIFLSRTSSERLGYTYRTDADRGAGYYIDKNGRPTWRLGTCIHSLLAFNPEQFKEGTVVIDEIDQVLVSLLMSNPCNDDGKRPALLARLDWFLKTANRVIVASADVDQAIVEYLAKLRGGKPYIVRNTYKEPGYHCTLLKGDGDANILGQVVTLVDQGKKLFIATDSKKRSELQRQLVSAGIPEDQISLVNSDTSGQEEQRELIKNVNEKIVDYLVVIGSPSLATGLSVEVDHFDYVIGIFYGVLKDSDISQALKRVRANIPRIVWVADRGKEFNKVSSSDNAYSVKKALKTRWETEVALIRTSLNPDLIPVVDAPALTWDECPHKTLWAHLVAETNFSMWNLYDNVAARLKYEGNTVEEVRTGEPCSDWLKHIKERRERIDQDHYKAVANSPLLDKTAIEQIKAKDSVSSEEKLAIEKSAIADFIATDEVSPQLVEEFPELVRGIPRLEDLQHNIAIERDEKTIKKQAKWGYGLHVPDMPTRERERFIREKLGLMPLLEQLLQGKVFANEDLEQLGEMVRTHYKQVNEVLKLGVAPNSKKWSNIRIFNKLVRQLAIPAKYERSGKENKGTTQLDDEKWGLVAPIIERREARRQQQLKEQVPIVDEGQFKTGDIGRYIYKQSPMSPNPMSPQPIPTPEVEETYTEDEQLEVEDCLSILNPVDNEELLHDREFHLSMMAALKGLSQRIRCAVWSRLPNWRRLQLKQWQNGYA